MDFPHVVSHEDLKTYRMVPAKIPEFLRRAEVRADRLMKAEFHPAAGEVGISFSMDGMNIASKRRVLVKYESADILASIVHASDFTFVEGTGDLPQRFGASAIIDAVKAIGQVMDAKRHEPAADIFLPTPMVEGRLAQYAFLPNGAILKLNVPGETGIGCIRYDPLHNQLVGVKIGKNGRGNALATLDLYKVLREPCLLQDMSAWRSVYQFNVSVDFLSRPKLSPSGRVYFVVNLHDLSETVLVLSEGDGAPSCRRGQSQPTHRRSIGCINGSDRLFVGYEPGADHAILQIERPVPETVAAVYMG